jgi:hypothetical protein
MHIIIIISLIMFVRMSSCTLSEQKNEYKIQFAHKKQKGLIGDRLE